MPTEPVERDAPLRGRVDDADLDARSGQRHQDVRPGGVSLSTAAGLGHRGPHGLAPAGEFPPKPPQVPGEIARGSQCGEQPLPRSDRPRAGRRPARHELRAQGLGRHQPAHAEGRADDLARRPEVDDDVGSESTQQWQRPDVVAQLTVVVVLEHPPALGAGAGHQGDPARGRQPPSEWVLVRGSAVDRGQVAGHGVHHQPVVVHRERHHLDTGVRQRAHHPLVAGVLDPDAAPPRKDLRDLRNPRGGAGGGEHLPGRGRESAVAQQVVRHRRAEGGVARRLGPGVRCEVAGRAPSPPPGRPVEHLEARGAGPQVDERMQPGLRDLGPGGGRRYGGRRAEDEGADAAAAAGPALGHQLVVGGRRDRSADPQRRGELPGGGQPVTGTQRAVGRRRAQGVGQLHGQRRAGMPIEHERRNVDHGSSSRPDGHPVAW